MKPVPPLFRCLNDVDLYTARRHFQEVHLPAGGRVFTAGEDANSVLVVIEGRLEVFRDGVKVGDVLPDDMVGEMALFDHGHRFADVVAAEDSHVLLLQREGYEALRDVVHPCAGDLERRTFANQVARLHRVGDRIAELSDGRVRAPVPPSERFLGAVAAMFGRGGLLSPVVVDAITTLRKNATFGDAPDEALAGIAAHMTPASYGPGAFLCTEGDRGDRMFLVDDGQVEVMVAVDEDRVQLLATLGPGSAFGMVALAERGARMCSCVAKGPVVVQTITAAGFEALMNDPTWAGTIFRRAMIAMLVGQLGASNAQLAAFEATRTADLSPLRRAAAVRDVHTGPEQ